MTKMQTKMNSRAFILFFLVLLLLFMTSAGCLKTVQKTMDGSNTNSSVLPETMKGTSDHTNMSLPVAVRTPMAHPVPKITPSKSNITSEALPILTPDPYPILHGTRINQTPQYKFIDRVPEYKKTYHLRGNATGLLVNVVEGPLYIVYVVTPQLDCMVSPDSCRGTMTVPATRPYLKITVRDDQTHEIVAEEGYAREYSSDTGNYIISVSTKEGSTTSTPGPRYIPIYKEGVYHLTIEGNYLDVDLSIITGTSPDPLDATMQSRSGQPAAPVATPPPENEEERW
jgi:hypothetical protein